MNSEIVKVFDGFTVNGKEVPVRFMTYEGHGEPYVIFGRECDDGPYAGDDSILGYVTYYDFDVYSRGNFTELVEAVKDKMENAGWMWQVSRSSSDMYEDDTGYFHVTLSFAKERGI